MRDSGSSRSVPAEKPGFVAEPYPDRDIDVRDIDGRLVRRVSPGTAKKIVALGSGEPVGHSQVRYIRLYQRLTRSRLPRAECNFTIHTEHNHSNHEHIVRRCAQFSAR